MRQSQIPHSFSQTTQIGSRNQSHRGSTTSFVQMVKGGEPNKDKEKRYSDKIKHLKGENKKLVTLLRDSERLFYQKLQETKKESENLSLLFK